MKKFGWCYIGAGGIAIKTANELIKTDDSRIVSVWNRTHAKTTLLAQAIKRYDYIVLYKKSNHEDFINRKDSPKKTETFDSLYLNMEEKKVNSAAIIIIISASILTLATFSLLVLKLKKKEIQ